MDKELFGNDWDEVLNDEFEKPYYSKLREFLKKNMRKKRFIHRWMICGLHLN